MDEFMNKILSDSKNGREYWDEKLKEYLPNYFLDNMTDFNDSTCFTYFIGCNNCHFKIGSDSLRKYLQEDKIAYYVKLQISIRNPIMCILFCKYEKSGACFNTSETPYTKSQQQVFSILTNFAKENDLEWIPYSELIKSIINIEGREQLEYHYLFEEEI